MPPFLTGFVSIALVIGFDWVATDSMGAKATSFDYRHWPLSKARIFSIILLSISVTITVLFRMADPKDPPLWPLFLNGPPLLIWGLVAWIDFLAQRRNGHREPPRYPEPDSDAEALRPHSTHSGHSRRLRPGRLPSLPRRATARRMQPRDHQQEGRPSRAGAIVLFVLGVLGTIFLCWNMLDGVIYIHATA